MRNFQRPDGTLTCEFEHESFSISMRKERDLMKMKPATWRVISVSEHGKPFDVPRLRFSGQTKKQDTIDLVTSYLTGILVAREIMETKSPTIAEEIAILDAECAADLRDPETLLLGESMTRPTAQQRYEGLINPEFNF